MCNLHDILKLFTLYSLAKFGIIISMRLWEYTNLYNVYIGGLGSSVECKCGKVYWMVKEDKEYLFELARANGWEIHMYNRNNN